MITAPLKDYADVINTLLMKRLLFTAILGIVLNLPMTAQVYTNSRYYNHTTGKLEYDKGYYGYGSVYYGFRIGPVFTTISSDNKNLDGGKVTTGLNAGFVMGYGLSDRTPLFMEGGLFYTEKGGKNDNNLFDYEYNLNYLEVPLVMKYIYELDNDITIQPLLGVYMACGIGGKIKDYNRRDAYCSFSGSDDAFKRLDAGLRFGIGIGFDMFYADISYDLGLANISHDNFDECHTSAWMINIGVNF